MPEHDPLARRMVTCPKCKGAGGSTEPDGYGERGWSPYFGCKGTGKVPEPAEVWAERLAKMCKWLAKQLEHRLPPSTRFQYADDWIARADEAARLLKAEKATEDSHD